MKNNLTLKALDPQMGFPSGSAVKETCLQCRRHGLDPQVGKIPLRSKRQHTPVFFPGKTDGQRSLEVYTTHPQGCKESDTAEQLSVHTHTCTLTHFNESSSSTPRAATCHTPLSVDPPGKNTAMWAVPEWGAVPSSRASSLPRDGTPISYVSCIGRWVLHCQHHPQIG